MARLTFLTLLLSVMSACTPTLRQDLAEVYWDRAVNRMVFCATVLALGGDECMGTPLYYSDPL